MVGSLHGCSRHGSLSSTFINLAVRHLTEAEIPKPGKYDKIVSVSVVAGISERGPTRLEFLSRSWKNEDVARG
jgi:hypothetical protein